MFAMYINIEYCNKTKCCFLKKLFDKIIFFLIFY